MYESNSATAYASHTAVGRIHSVHFVLFDCKQDILKLYVLQTTSFYVDFWKMQVMCFLYINK
jgi:hypothetical protein